MSNPYALVNVDKSLLSFIEDQLNTHPNFMNGNQNVGEHLKYFSTLSDKDYLSHLGCAARFTCMLHQCTTQHFQHVDNVLGELTARLQLHILYCQHNIKGEYHDYVDTNDLRSIAIDMAVSAMPAKSTDLDEETLIDGLGVGCVNFMKSKIFKR